MLDDIFISLIPRQLLGRVELVSGPGQVEIRNQLRYWIDDFCSFLRVESLTELSAIGDRGDFGVKITFVA